MRGVDMSRSVILCVPAHPAGTTRLALDEECAAIERELKLTPGRDDFELRSKWAVTVDDLMRHLHDLQPTILHFSGHGRTPELAPEQRREGMRDVIDPSDEPGLLLVGDSGQPVAPAALRHMIRAAAATVRLIVLDACYSDAQAEALRDAVGCAVGMKGRISDDAARAFAVGFYRALGYGRSIRSAYKYAAAELAGKGLAAEAEPRCLVREGEAAEPMLLSSATPRAEVVPMAQPAVVPAVAVAAPDDPVIPGFGHETSEPQPDVGPPRTLAVSTAGDTRDDARHDDDDDGNADRKLLNDRRSRHDVAMRQRTARFAANMVLMFVVGVLAVGVGLAMYFQSSRPLFALIASVATSVGLGAALLSKAWGDKLASRIERSLAEHG
jgi:CHAT domain-containing protein